MLMFMLVFMLDPVHVPVPKPGQPAAPCRLKLRKYWLMGTQITLHYFVLPALRAAECSRPNKFAHCNVYWIFLSAHVTF
jgi:hypothetical protein